jgi:GNAT superfamily N-acetyltransferase
MKIEQGSIADWRKLCSFHYRGHRVAAPRKIFRLVRGDELCGVIVYVFPPPACYGRRLVLPRMSMQELNSHVSTINRVVVHPKYRSIGLGAKLIRETLPLAGTPYVEMIAVMAKYNPFAEKAGMRKTAIQQPTKDIHRLSQTLDNLGLELCLLGSQNYVQEKLRSLTSENLESLRNCLMRNSHPRFKKEFSGSRHVPYGNSADFQECIRNADIAKLARLVRIVGMLLQTKVYLFWHN